MARAQGALVVDVDDRVPEVLVGVGDVAAVGVAVELVGQRLGLGGEQVGQNDSAALGLEPAAPMRTGTRSASSRAHAMT